MYKFVAFVDIDGTLRDAREGKGEVPRPFIAELFESITKLNGAIFIWSGGGKEYAEQAIMRIARTMPSPRNFMRQVKACFWKRWPIEVSKEYIGLPLFFIDDEYSLVAVQRRYGQGGFVVSYYDSTSGQPDDELWLARKEVEEWGSKLIGTSPA